MKFKLSATFLAAAFVVLLSCPFRQLAEAQGTEAPPTDEGAGISVGVATPDPSVPAAPTPESDPVYARDREPIRLELHDHRVRIERLEARKGFRATVITRRNGRRVARVVQAPTLNQLVTALQKQGFVTNANLATVRTALGQLRQELAAERAERTATDEGIKKEVSRLSRLYEAWIAKNLPLVIFLGGLAFGLVVAIFGTVALVGVAYRN